jgi:hypothetical protein
VGVYSEMEESNEHRDTRRGGRGGGGGGLERLSVAVSLGWIAMNTCPLGWRLGALGR